MSGDKVRSHALGNYLRLYLFLLPPAFIAVVAILAATFPSPLPAPRTQAPNSLAVLPPNARSMASSIYPEDFLPNGSYISMPPGQFRYWMLGPEKGSKVVLVHGLSIPSIIWKDVAQLLAMRGYRILLFDLYGRGYADAPDTVYNTELYINQLALLMQVTGWQKARIVGISMGGGVTAAFASSFPHLVDNKIALLSSAGVMKSSDMSRTSKLLSSPFMQSVLESFPLRYYLRRSARKSRGNSMGDLIRLQSAYLPGYNRAIASSVRYGPIRGLESSFSALNTYKTAVLLIWGTLDTTIPYQYASKIKSLVPSAEVVTINDGAHDLTLSHPTQVVDALDSFFRRK